jgi:hypothetical protein
MLRLFRYLRSHWALTFARPTTLGAIHGGCPHARGTASGVVPTHVGVNRTARRTRRSCPRCPHARGGEPCWASTSARAFPVVPTHVGVNRRADHGRVASTCCPQARLLLDRREFLRVGGGLAVAGFSLPPLRAGQPRDASSASGEKTGGAKTCILVYLLGGPSHIDTFDLKPDAPAEYRGPFRPIATSVPGTQLCEHLPRLAGIADKYALVRSVSHRNSNHTPMIYYTLTGRHTDQPERDNDIRPPQRTDFPHLGAVVARYRHSTAGLPGYVALPEVAIRSSIRGEYHRARTPLRGGGAGFLARGRIAAPA